MSLEWLKATVEVCGLMSWTGDSDLDMMLPAEVSLLDSEVTPLPAVLLLLLIKTQAASRSCVVLLLVLVLCTGVTVAALGLCTSTQQTWEDRMSLRVSSGKLAVCRSAAWLSPSPAIRTHTPRLKSLICINKQNSLPALP